MDQQGLKYRYSLKLSSYNTSQLIPMFKQNPQPRSKSPYQPKLIQHLIDSSDEDNDSFSSGQNEEHSFSNQQNEESDYSQSFKSRFNNIVNEDQRSQKSSHTTVTQQTMKSNITKQSTNTVKFVPNQQNLKSYANQQKLQPPNNNNMSNNMNSIQSRSSKANLSHSNQDSLFSSLSQNQKTSQSPAIQIKYDTLKLSEYNTEEAKMQERLFHKNINQFREKFNTAKPIQTRPQVKQNICIQEEQQNNGYIDSLEAMKNSNLNRNQFSRKQPKKESSTPSSRIKFLQQQRDEEQLREEEDNRPLQNPSQVVKLRQQLKRSKDVIKTLGLKNSDLQKTLQMRNTKLQQLESQTSSRLTIVSSQKQCQNIERQVYGNINLYMKETVRDFMDQVKNIKMNPLLEQNLENFLAEILQLNSLSVNKKLGIQQNYIEMNQYENHDNQNVIHNRLTKSIFNTRSPLNQREDIIQNDQEVSNITKNRFQTVHTQSHISVVKNRQNAFMSSKVDNHAMKGVTVRVDLSSNKENLTPNKRPTADEQFKLLQKSLHKLKAMETTLQQTPLQKSIKTPAPKRQQNLAYNKSQLNFNQDDCRNQYSIINRSCLSGLGRDDNSALNVSAGNLDRSKSRRKRIFADTNHKQ